jgi:hypothetical protein
VDWSTREHDSHAPFAATGRASVPATRRFGRAAGKPAVQRQMGGRRRGTGTVRGIARGVQLRSEAFGQGSSQSILSMRVEQYDASGNRLQPVPVEMRGLTLSGQVSEGEQVEVRGTWRGGVLRATRAANLSTGGTIDTYPGRHIALYLVAIALFVAFVMFMFTL